MSGSDYREIQRELLDRIQSRQWPAGALLPNETALAREFGCARATIGKALGEIAKAGLIQRKRKAGTTVSINPVRRAVMEIPVIRQEVENRGQTYRHLVLDKEMTAAPDPLRARMTLPDQAQVLHIRTLHLADNMPYIHEDRWINPAPLPALATAPFETISANEWLVANAPLSGGDIVFSAEGATPKDAQALDVAQNAPLFIVERLTHYEETTITFARLAYIPGFRKTTRF